VSCFQLDTIKIDLKRNSVWTGTIWLEYGTFVGCCKYDNELSGAIKDNELLEQLTKHQLLKKVSAYRVNLVEAHDKGHNQNRTSVYSNMKSKTNVV
jgi:hypothetical protein